MLAKSKEKRTSWSTLAQRIREIVLIEGHGPGSEVEFVDYIPGPRLMEAFPLEPNAEGVKLRARIIAQHPEMEAHIAKHKADGLDSLVQ